MQNTLAYCVNAIQRADLRLSDASSGLSIAGHIRESGRVEVLAWVISELETVNEVTGVSLGANAIQMCAELIIDRFKFRTPNALRIALRDGLNSGKIYGKLTYPIIAEWLTEHEERMEQHGYQQHMATK